LDVGIVLVEAEIEEPGFRFIMPAGGRVVFPELGGAGLEGNSIERHAKKGVAGGGNLLRGDWMQRYPEGSLDFCQGVGIAFPRKRPGLVVGPSIGANEAVVSLSGDGDPVGGLGGPDAGKSQKEDAAAQEECGTQGGSQLGS